MSIVFRSAFIAFSCITAYRSVVWSPSWIDFALIVVTGTLCIVSTDKTKLEVAEKQPEQTTDPRLTEIREAIKALNDQSTAIAIALGVKREV